MFGLNQLSLGRIAVYNCKDKNILLFILFIVLKLFVLIIKMKVVKVSSIIIFIAILMISIIID